MTSIFEYLDFDPPLALACYPDIAAFHASETWLGRDMRYLTELAMVQFLGDERLISGYCWLCSHRRDFTFKAGADHPMPDWREELTCNGCGLFSRVRLGLLLAIWYLQATGSRRPYITEQVTPAYRHLARMYPETIGSEFVADGSARERMASFLAYVYAGSEPAVRHEDVMQLSLPSGSVDTVLSFEVLEHLPDYRAALSEFHRVLRPGGLLVLSVPFVPTEHDTIVRAVVGPDGSIRHLLEPEYHGDPAADAGCLAYYNFGWAILDDVRQAGFESAGAVDAWSPPSGFLGSLSGLFLARKSKSKPPGGRASPGTIDN